MAAVETRTDGEIGIVTVNRPEALNAVNNDVIDGLVEATRAFDEDDQVAAIVITGEGKAFIAGADIKAMSERSYMDMFMENKMGELSALTRVRKPMIAAVNGFALGGGCEIAMMCDIIIASDKAKFGQPEIRLGVIPGWGGTQRLTRALGKVKAMDMVLTGRMIDAEEAEKAGLVSRVVPHDSLMDTTLEVARTVAGFSRPAVMIAKEAVNRAEESTLAEGLLFEQRVFYSLFATEDQKEGMAAFIEKRKPSFKNR